MFDEKKLDFYIEKEKNVLFRGRHGVGKTAMVKDAFERNNLNWVYFSAATMDPWVDFIGVPKEKFAEDGTSYLDLVRPKNFENGMVEAIFMDELNRAKPKVRNAVMELIQFGSINGREFPNLKFVWAAINPEDEEDEDLKYDVEVLDPAQKDRFHIIMDIPYEPSVEYFEKKFGSPGVGAVEWWNEIPHELTKLVSPRRLEYAVQEYLDDGDLRDVLVDDQLNISQLRQRLSSGSIVVKLAELLVADDAECKTMFSNANFTTDAVPHIMDSEEYIKRFTSFMQSDIVGDLLIKDNGTHMEKIIRNAPHDAIAPIMSTIKATSGVKRTLVQLMTKLAEEEGIDLTSEDAFRTAIDQGIAVFSSGEGDRARVYAALQSINNNFNTTATQDVYDRGIQFIVDMLESTGETSLQDSKRPYHQVGKHILERIDKSLQTNFDATVMESWTNTVKPSMDPNKDIEKIEKYLKLFLTDKKV